ncbi:MAG: tRNA 2-selenouridine(34) synthase MnmH [Spirochaetes bacterium]|nr:tRNA 2-selenouridine(34) synthase MnmH [Spirochaetota bacterium]
MNEISYAESLSLPDRVYIDVRSPSEFGADSVPGSVNIPLFDDAERREVGTLYRAAGREDAVMRGTEIAGAKLKELVGAFLDYRDRNMVILCARGGMRSSSLASLLASLGLSVYRLRDGYRGYRRHVFDRIGAMTMPAPLYVLQGLTGTGKTEILRALPNSIDLEQMAGHRSSVFGGIGLVPVTQKRFESLIVERLDALVGAPWILVEGESRKIGDLHMPERLHEMMQSAPVILIEAPMRRRQQILYEEYHGHCDDENIPSIVRGLTSRLGKKQVEELLEIYTRGELGEFIRIMLEKYYDPLYLHSLKEKKYIARIANLERDRTIREIRLAIENHLEGRP